MNKNVSKESKLKLLDFLEEELEVRKATVKNLLRNNRNEKERCSSSLESSEDNLAILIDCERSFRRFMKDLGELDENLKILKAWRSEISDAEMGELGILPSFSIYNYLLANLTEINIYWLFMNIFPKKICS